MRGLAFLLVSGCALGAALVCTSGVLGSLRRSIHAHSVCVRLAVRRRWRCGVSLVVGGAGDVIWWDGKNADGQSTEVWSWCRPPLTSRVTGQMSRGANRQPDWLWTLVCPATIARHHCFLSLTLNERCLPEQNMARGYGCTQAGLVRTAQWETTSLVSGRLSLMLAADRPPPYCVSMHGVNVCTVCTEAGRLGLGSERMQVATRVEGVLGRRRGLVGFLMTMLWTMRARS
jgi:hypothetical protein